MNDLNFYKVNYLKLKQEKMNSSWGRTDEQYEYALERIEELETQLNQYEKGFIGACPTCEVVGELNVELESQLKEANELLKKANNYGGCEFKEINEYFEKYNACNENNTIV